MQEEPMVTYLPTHSMGPTARQVVELGYKAMAGNYTKCLPPKDCWDTVPELPSIPGCPSELYATCKPQGSLSLPKGYRSQSYLQRAHLVDITGRCAGPPRRDTAGSAPCPLQACSVLSFHVGLQCLGSRRLPHPTRTATAPLSGHTPWLSVSRGMFPGEHFTVFTVCI